jgi:hypothetical protein
MRFDMARCIAVGLTLLSLITADGGIHSAVSRDRSSLLFDIKRVGVSPNNVVQSHSFDPKNGYIFSLHQSTTFNGKRPYAVINRYAAGQSVDEQAIDSAVPTDQIGHQGLAVEPTTGRLWASAPETKGSGIGATRFSYVPNSSIKDVQSYQLFPVGTGGSTTPTVSTDGRLLIVKANDWRGNGPKRSSYKIRVFDLPELVRQGPGDYSSKYMREWTLSEEVTEADANGYRPPLQALASDGRFIYVLLSAADMDHKSVVGKYTVDGKFVGSAPLDIGKRDALEDGSGKHFEGESLAFLSTGSGNVLTVGIASGDKGARKFRIYNFPNL